MSLKIQEVKKDKFFDIGDGAKLCYQYLEPLEQLRFIRKYERNAKMAEGKAEQMAFDLMVEMVTNWKNVINEDNKPIKFKKELIKMLPTGVVVNFIMKIVSPLFEEIGKDFKETNLGN